MYQSTKYILLAAVLGLSIIATTAVGDTKVGATFFSWLAEGGELAFTNIKERIPVKYKDDAGEKAFEDMVDRRTEMIITAKEQRERLQTRLDYLRAQNEVEIAPVEPTVIVIKVEETRRRIRGRGPGK